MTLPTVYLGNCWLLGLEPTSLCQIWFSVLCLVFWKVIENAWSVISHWWWGPGLPVSCGEHHLIDPVPADGPLSFWPWSQESLPDHGLWLTFLLPSALSHPFLHPSLKSHLWRSQLGPPKGPWSVRVMWNHFCTLNWILFTSAPYGSFHQIWTHTVLYSMCARQGVEVGGWDFLLDGKT